MDERTVGSERAEAQAFDFGNLLRAGAGCGDPRGGPCLGHEPQGDVHGEELRGHDAEQHQQLRCAGLDGATAAEQHAHEGTRQRHQPHGLGGVDVRDQRFGPMRLQHQRDRLSAR